MWLFDAAERRVRVRFRAYEGRNAIFSPREYPVNKRRMGNLSARITQSGGSNIAMACRQNLTGRVSLLLGTTGKLDVSVYAAC